MCLDRNLLGCPWKLVTIVSKLVYNLFTGLTTYLNRGYNPFTKYYGHPSRENRSVYRSLFWFGILLILPSSDLFAPFPCLYLLGCLVFLGDTPKAWICVSLMRKQKVNQQKFSPKWWWNSWRFSSHGIQVSHPQGFLTRGRSLLLRLLYQIP